MAKLIIHHRAANYIKRMDPRIKRQLVAKLAKLADDPEAMPGIKPMAGEWTGFYRFRHGDLRIIYSYERSSDTIMVAHVGPRGDVYK